MGENLKAVHQGNFNGSCLICGRWWTLDFLSICSLLKLLELKKADSVELLL